MLLLLKFNMNVVFVVLFATNGSTTLLGSLHRRCVYRKPRIFVETFYYHLITNNNILATYSILVPNNNYSV